MAQNRPQMLVLKSSHPVPYSHPGPGVVYAIHRKRISKNHEQRKRRLGGKTGPNTHTYDTEKCQKNTRYARVLWVPKHGNVDTHVFVEMATKLFGTSAEGHTVHVNRAVSHHGLCHS